MQRVAVFCCLLLAGAVARAETAAVDSQARGCPALSWSRLGDALPAARTGRAWLEDHGVRVDLTHALEALGGRQRTGPPRRAREALSLLTARLRLSTSGLGLWEGGELVVEGQVLTGQGLSDELGLAQPVSGNEAPAFSRLTNLTLRQDWSWGWVRLGKQDANDHFAFAEHGARFLHSSAGLPPNAGLPSFPDAEWGLVVHGGVSWAQATFGAFQGEPDGGRSARASFGRLRGPILVGALRLTHEARLPGSAQVGVWWDGTDAQRISRSRSPRALSSSYGVFLVADQWLLGDVGHGVAAFGQASWAPGDRAEISRYFGGGVVATGLVPHRDGDSFGVGIFHARFSTSLGRRFSSETAFEAFYLLEVTPYLRLTVDGQAIRHPDGAKSGVAWVAGVRLELDL